MKKLYTIFLASLLSLLVVPCLYGAPAGSVNDLIGFESDYAAALKRAKESSRDVFILFTGSDWCRWCNIFESEVLSRKEFLDYATNEWELVVADFPKYKKLSPELRKQNSELRKKYDVRGFPTVVLTDAEGKKLCAGGYSKGRAEAWLKNFIKEKEVAPFAKKYLSPIEKKINDLDEKVVKELFDTTSINENDLKAICQHRKNVAVKYLPEVKALIKELESIQVPSVLSGKKAGMMKDLKFMNTELQRTVDTQ